MSLAAGLPCVPTFRVPSSQVYHIFDVQNFSQHLPFVIHPAALAFVIRPLASSFQDLQCQEPALKLMLLLTDAGVSQSADVGTEMIAGGAVPKLVQLLSASDSMQEMAAAVLGNLCHESPENQDKRPGQICCFTVSSINNFLYGYAIIPILMCSFASLH